MPCPTYQPDRPPLRSTAIAECQRRPLHACVPHVVVPRRGHLCTDGQPLEQTFELSTYRYHLTADHAVCVVTVVCCDCLSVLRPWMHRWMVLLPLPETSTTSSCSTDTQTFEGERTRWVESGRTHTQSYSADQNKKFAFCATACNSHTRALSLVVHIEQLALLHSALVQCKHLCACTESLPIDSPIVDGRTHHAITFHFGVTHRNRILACVRMPSIPQLRAAPAAWCRRHTHLPPFTSRQC
jgi:hypothetical protein